MSTKAIIVHPAAEVHDWVGQIKPDWDIQVPVDSVERLWEYLNDGTLSSDSRYIFISDLLVQTEGDEVYTVIANFAPYATIIVLSQMDNMEEVIRQGVFNAAETFGFPQKPFYFLETQVEDPSQGLNQIIAEADEEASRQQESTQVVAPVSETTPANEEAPEPDEYHDSDIQYQNSLQQPGILIASTSSKGGSGKTTVAMCTAITISKASQLAYEQGLAPAPLKVAIVDMDVRDGQIGFSIEKTTPSIMNYFVDEDKSIEGLKKFLIPVPRYGVDALLAPKRGRTAEYLTPEFYRGVLENLRLLYDVIILDTSVNYLDPLLSQVVYPDSDAILFVTNLSKGAVYGMPRWMNEVTAPVEEHGAGVPKEKIGVVINQSMGQVGMDIELLKKCAKGAPLLVAIPADSLRVVAASNNMKLDELIRKHEEIGKEYYTLVSTMWRNKTPLISPLEDYLDSDEKKRDDVLAAQGKSTSSIFVHRLDEDTDTPEPPKRFFGRKNK